MYPDNNVGYFSWSRARLGRIVININFVNIVGCLT